MSKKFSRSTSFKEVTSPDIEVRTMDSRRHEQPLGAHGPLQHEDLERKSHTNRRPDRRPSVDSYAADEPYISNPSTARSMKTGIPEDVPEMPSRPPGARGIPGQFEPRTEPEDRGHSDYHGGRNTYPHRADVPHMERHRSKANVNGPDTYSDSEGGYPRGVGSDSKVRTMHIVRPCHSEYHNLQRLSHGTIKSVKGSKMKFVSMAKITRMHVQTRENGNGISATLQPQSSNNRGKSMTYQRI